MADVIKDLNDRVRRIEADSQTFQQNQVKESENSASNQKHRRQQPHYHRRPQSDHLSEGDNSSSDSEFDGFFKPSWQCYRQPPPEFWKRRSNWKPPPEYEKWQSNWETPPEYKKRPDKCFSDENCLCDWCFGWRKKDLPLFNGNLKPGEFRDWIFDVERYFKFYEIPEDKKVELVVTRLEQTALSWWEQIQNLTSLINKPPIQEWTEKKMMMIIRFLHANNDEVEELPFFNNNHNVDEFCKWIHDVERFFKNYKKGDFLWWEEIQNLWKRLRKQLIEMCPRMKWAQMKTMLITRFLLEDCDRGVYLPLLEKNLDSDELNEWMRGFERFFRVYEISVEEEVEVVSKGIEEGVFAWWQKMQNLRRRIDMQQWKDMK